LRGIGTQRLDLLMADHHVDVVDEEEAAGKPLVDVSAGDRDRRVAHDVTLGSPPAHQGIQALELRAGRRRAAGTAGVTQQPTGDRAAPRADQGQRQQSSRDLEEASAEAQGDAGGVTGARQLLDRPAQGVEPCGAAKGPVEAGHGIQPRQRARRVRGPCRGTRPRGRGWVVHVWLISHAGVSVEEESSPRTSLPANATNSPQLIMAARGYVQTFRQVA
jgi:hypothetical protein